MRTRLLSFVAGAGCLLGLGLGPAMAGIHFLAIDVPADTAWDVVDSKQPEISRLIAAQAPEYSGLILYHTVDNLHISLIRFNEIPTDSLLNSYIALFNRDADKLPSKNIADKLRKASLDVTKSGYIVYVFPEPKSLTTFATALINDLYQAKLNYQGTDFPSDRKTFPHFSVGRFDPGVVSVDRMRKILKGRVPAPTCAAFKLNTFCLKHSEEPFAQLSYSNTAVFHAHPSVSDDEGDYGADEAADPTVYQSDTGDWQFQMSTNGYTPQTITGVASSVSVRSPFFARKPYGLPQGESAVVPKELPPSPKRLWRTGWQDKMAVLASAVALGAMADKSQGSAKMPRDKPRGASLSVNDAAWQPVSADYDGDGLADPAIYEPAAGTWSLRLSDSNYELTTITVAPGGVPVW